MAEQHFAPLPPPEYDFDLLARWLATQRIAEHQLPTGIITFGNYTDTTDYANVPNANTITHTHAVAVEYAGQPVYVEVAAYVRWKDMTVGKYVWSRPTVNGTAAGLITIDVANVTTHLTQGRTWSGTATADSSGNITFGTQCNAEDATSDVNEVEFVWKIWRQPA